MASGRSLWLNSPSQFSIAQKSCLWNPDRSSLAQHPINSSREVYWVGVSQVAWRWRVQWLMLMTGQHAEPTQLSCHRGKGKTPNVCVRVPRRRSREASVVGYGCRGSSVKYFKVYHSFIFHVSYFIPLGGSPSHQSHRRQSSSSAMTQEDSPDRSRRVGAP